MNQSWCSIPHYDWANGGSVDVQADQKFYVKNFKLKVLRIYNLKLEQAMRNRACGDQLILHVVI